MSSCTTTQLLLGVLPLRLISSKHSDNESSNEDVIPQFMKQPQPISSVILSRTDRILQDQDADDVQACVSQPDTPTETSDTMLLVKVQTMTSSSGPKDVEIKFRDDEAVDNESQKPLSEKKRAKYEPMYNIIQKSKHGPHPQRPPFNPSFNIQPTTSDNTKTSVEKEDQMTKRLQDENIKTTSPGLDIIEEQSKERTVSVIFEQVDRKKLCRRILEKPRKYQSARKSYIAQFDAIPITDCGIGWDGSVNGWGSEESFIETSGGTLRDLGILVATSGSTWEEQQKCKKGSYRCYKPSHLRTSWCYATGEELSSWE